MTDISTIDLALRFVDALVVPMFAAFGWWMRQQGERADKLRGELIKLRDELAAFKVEVAEKRASNGFIVEVRDELRGDVWRLEAKLDRLLELHVGRQRPPE